jgi:hypothetical protein
MVAQLTVAESWKAQDPGVVRWWIWLPDAYRSSFENNKSKNITKKKDQGQRPEMLVKDWENESERIENNWDNERKSDMCNGGREGDEAYGYGGNETSERERKADGWKWVERKRRKPKRSAFVFFFFFFFFFLKLTAWRGHVVIPRRKGNTTGWYHGLYSLYHGRITRI